MSAGSINIAFLMDAGILVLLAATVFVAFKLTLSFRAFKNSRAEMDDSVLRIVAAIDQARSAIGDMNATARRHALELDEIINDAKKITAELRVMNEAGDSLADRLEQLADRNLDLLKNGMERIDPVERRIENIAMSEKIVVFTPEKDPVDQRNGQQTMQSLAERELFDALQNSLTRQRSGA